MFDFDLTRVEWRRKKNSFYSFSLFVYQEVCFEVIIYDYFILRSEKSQAL